MLVVEGLVGDSLIKSNSKEETDPGGLELAVEAMVAVRERVFCPPKTDVPGDPGLVTLLGIGFATIDCRLLALYTTRSTVASLGRRWVENFETIVDGVVGDAGWLSAGEVTVLNDAWDRLELRDSTCRRLEEGTLKLGAPPTAIPLSSIRVVGPGIRFSRSR